MNLIYHLLILIDYELELIAYLHIGGHIAFWIKKKKQLSIIKKIKLTLDYTVSCHFSIVNFM